MLAVPNADINYMNEWMFNDTPEQRSALGCQTKGIYSNG